ncbi:MerR family transcriptional regulator [Streptomyces oceani]|uniref:Protein phosphatase n=1 Tax=Streptomyces oceani TaxID=1075402 RepID=A0A1E7JF53_9ACTN|nr:MerR family transcriptional regulator [Streptomyces oceani]OEU85095.1 hypothetical protein AN216_26315 [Streptomyces oceani]
MGSEGLTIGQFARLSRLSPKALRLYDRLGLLPPARVDPSNGYRRYEPEQLEQARLVAWLRRLGMPLADIQRVCGLGPGAAAREVRAYWARVERDTAARRDLAAFLIDQLSWKDTVMSRDQQPERYEQPDPAQRPLEIRYAALSDRGLVRESNQDTAYAGERLLAVADGFGSGGAPASEAAIEALRCLEEPRRQVPAGALLNILEDTLDQVGSAVRGVASAGREPAEAGTTLTAMLWAGSRLALVHIGDSRAYLLRDGELRQITQDHTLVRSMVDEGRLTEEEAATHPQRSLLVRALGGSGETATPEVRLRESRPGDRYLLCSDGLSAVVPSADLRHAVTSYAEPERAVRELVATANRAGGPDNISCVVADVLPPAE